MSTTIFEFRERLDVMSRELAQLEEKAGITAAVEKVNEGCFIPYGIDGEGDHLPRNQQSENYFDSEFDHRRSGIRDIYFGVTEQELRKALIRKSRTIDRAYLERGIEDKMHALEGVSKAQAAFDKPNWTTVFFIVLISVALGIWKDGKTGLLLSVGGFFFAYLHRRDQVHRLKWELDRAKDELAMTTQDSEEGSNLRPERFSQSEELSGERDESLDALSAAYLRTLARESLGT